MVVKAFKRQIKSGNVFNDQLINVVFSNPEPTTIYELQERYFNLLAIKDYQYIEYLKQCGYEVNVIGKRFHFPGNAKEQVAGPSGINANQQKGGGSKTRSP